MMGVYEDRRWFSRYKPVLEVLENGVVYRDRIYAWRDVEDVGIHAIQFSDGNKCTVNPHTFRKKGKKARISFLGRNTTFRDLRNYLIRRQLESECDPRIKDLEIELDSLTSQMNGAEEVARISIERKIAHVRAELFRLQDLYISQVKQTTGHGKKNQWAYTVAALVLLLVIIWLRIEAP